MFRSSVEKLSDDQLRKKGRLFLGISIGMLAAMCFVLGMALYQISNGSDGIMAALSVPIIMGPLTFLPLLASNTLSKEVKKRKEQNQN